MTTTEATIDTANIMTLSDHRPTAKNLMQSVAMIRRAIRQTVAKLDSQRDKARCYRREARIIKERAGLFDTARIAALEALADDAGALCKPLRESLKDCGKLLVTLAPVINAGTTLAQRCEVLNVNIADRAGLTEADGLHEIVFIHGLEDSVLRRGQDWNDGEIFQALNYVFMDFLVNTREGKALGDSLFEAGGMFADLPTYRQSADGTMKRLPPRLSIVPTASNDSINLKEAR
ncbi:hypothetical protein [Glaciimonas immobilis]|uniref:Uncharacterized protein n=1 Tax=Glaciimonas immobilis TaxID=728004 RepID=A0A840RQX3_9BURK|nr:hypothetical protein [Glaciimonas immobilis]KAF3997486.1 hypothetical protein HAV38_12460 [Glaciimonas immobilis]MBB5200837.1 hypothetical protein [Glaciimonas immobilis]